MLGARRLGQRSWSQPPLPCTLATSPPSRRCPCPSSGLLGTGPPGTDLCRWAGQHPAKGRGGGGGACRAQAGPTPTARGCFLWGWSEASIPRRAGQGWQLGVGSFFTVRKRRQKGAQSREVGGLWPETTARARCGLGLERDVAPPAGLHGAEGPCGESWWGRRALLLLVVGGGGGNQMWGRVGEGPGPSVSSMIPDQGFGVPGGRCGAVPAPRRQSGHTGSCWPRPPPI